MFDSKSDPIIDEIVEILSEFTAEEIKDTHTFLRMVRAREVSRRLTDFALKVVISLAPVVNFFQGMRHV